MKNLISMIKKHKTAVIAITAVIIVLCVAFFTAPSLNPDDSTDVSLKTTQTQITPTNSDADSDENSDSQPTSEKKEKSTVEDTTSTGSASQPTTQVKSTSPTKNKKKQNSAVSATEATKDRYQTDRVPQGKPEPVEPQEQEIKDDISTCTISISCATVLNNMDKLTPSKASVVPKDGWILKPTKVKFNEGESVFDILQAVCREQKIHLESTFTPAFNSAYIEGIGNIYEFDCGELSGWYYKVNDWYPNYGCSRYQVKNGDNICFVYTCDFGYDIGKYN